MKDFQYTLESSRHVLVDRVGYYEVARLVIPRDPLYTIDLLWQFLGVLGEPPVSAFWANVYDPYYYQLAADGGSPYAKLRWLLRSQQTRRSGAGDWIHPATGPQDIPPKAFGGWPDRDIITDRWGLSDGGYNMLIRGPAVVSLIAHFHDGDIFEGTRVGGRLRAIAYPKEIGRALSIKEG